MFKRVCYTCDNNTMAVFAKALLGSNNFYCTFGDFGGNGFGQLIIPLCMRRKYFFIIVGRDQYNFIKWKGYRMYLF